VPILTNGEVSAERQKRSRKDSFNTFSPDLNHVGLFPPRGVAYHGGNIINPGREEAKEAQKEAQEAQKEEKGGQKEEKRSQK